jgi:hypothetical protein
MIVGSSIKGVNVDVYSHVDADYRPIRFPKGRKCANPDCGTILATDNEGPYCTACGRKQGECGTVAEMMGLSRIPTDAGPETTRFVILMYWPTLADWMRDLRLSEEQGKRFLDGRRISTSLWNDRRIATNKMIDAMSAVPSVDLPDRLTLDMDLALAKAWIHDRFGTYKAAADLIGMSRTGLLHYFRDGEKYGRKEAKRAGLYAKLNEAGGR